MQVSATGSLYVTGDFSGSADFDPGIGTANLTSSGGDAFIGVYDTTIIAGINTIAFDDASVNTFPNPADGNVYFVCNRFDNCPWSLEIADVAGKVIFQAENINTDIFHVDLGNVAAGIYFYTVRRENMILTKKLIIQ